LRLQADLWHTVPLHMLEQVWQFLLLHSLCLWRVIVLCSVDSSDVETQQSTLTPTESSLLIFKQYLFEQLLAGLRVELAITLDLGSNAVKKRFNTELFIAWIAPLYIRESWLRDKANKRGCVNIAEEQMEMTFTRKKCRNERLIVSLILKWDYRECDRIWILSLKYRNKQKYEYWVHCTITLSDKIATVFWWCIRKFYLLIYRFYIDCDELETGETLEFWLWCCDKFFPVSQSRNSRSRNQKSHLKSIDVTSKPIIKKYKDENEGQVIQNKQIQFNSS